MTAEYHLHMRARNKTTDTVWAQEITKETFDSVLFSSLSNLHRNYSITEFMRLYQLSNCSLARAPAGQGVIGFHLKLSQAINSWTIIAEKHVCIGENGRGRDGEGKRDKGQRTRDED